jgi:hypothetical protein
MLNGNGALDTSTHRLLNRVRDELSAGRLQVLVDAVNEHQTRAERFFSGRRPHDQELYRRMSEIVDRGSSRSRA